MIGWLPLQTITVENLDPEHSVLYVDMSSKHFGQRQVPSPVRLVEDDRSDMFPCDYFVAFDTDLMRSPKCGYYPRDTGDLIHLHQLHDI